MPPGTRETSLKKARNHKKVEDAGCLPRLREAIPALRADERLLRNSGRLVGAKLGWRPYLQSTHAARPAGGRARPEADAGGC